MNTTFFRWPAFCARAERARMTTSSMGELGASGHEEGGCARDGKVEITLSDEARDDTPYEHPDVDRG
jgi:hypothetical protein